MQERDTGEPLTLPTQNPQSEDTPKFKHLLQNWLALATKSKDDIGESECESRRRSGPDDEHIVSFCRGRGILACNYDNSRPLHSSLG